MSSALRSRPGARRFCCLAVPPSSFNSSHYLPLHKISTALSRRGCHPGPVVDLSCSGQYESSFFWMRAARAQVSALPLTQPADPMRGLLGFCCTDPRILLGNATAFACLLLALLEQPRLSKMRWLSVWKWLRSLPGAAENWLASCVYGAPFRTEFALLGHLLDLDSIHKHCPGNHQHVRIDGSITKQTPSVTLAWPLPLPGSLQTPFSRGPARKTRGQAEWKVWSSTTSC